MKYRCLFSPGRIGRMQIKNRLVMAPMGTYLAGRDGMVTDRLKSYYEERARGGVGLIIVEVASIDYPRGRVMTRQLGISDDKFIPGLAALAEVVHKHGARIAIQLQHGGRIAAPFLSGGHEAVSASVIPLVPAELGVTRELTLEEIAILVQRFAEAALRAQKAGIDGVEIHAGHGYLINEFLSGATNKRQDIYGGSLENRARFLVEIIKSVRQAVGQEYPVWCRLDGREFGIEKGITQGEALEYARMAVEAGVEAVHVSGYGGSQGAGFAVAPLVNTPGLLLPLAREIKKRVQVPVIAVGRLTLDQSEKALSRGEADFIALGRPLLADPELPGKIAEGREDQIRPCIYCYTCVHQIFVRGNVCCAVNPATGKESEPVPDPPVQSKKVMVVGGGPAGLAAAVNAARRGHQVNLYDKEKKLGGSLYFASLIRRENEDIIRYLSRELRRLNVGLYTGQTVTPELVAREKPDVLILATGVVRRLPDLPGIKGPNVISGDDLRSMLSSHMDSNIVRKLGRWQNLVLSVGKTLAAPFLTPEIISRLTHFWMPLGKRVVILGAGTVGCELAVFLMERGRTVTLVEEGEQIAPEMALPFKWMLLEKLEKRQVPILTQVKCHEITSDSVIVLTKEGTKQSLEANSVIIASGAEPDPVTLALFKDRAPEVYFAGDCSKLSFIKDSIADGTRIGSGI